MSLVPPRLLALTVLAIVALPTTATAAPVTVSGTAGDDTLVVQGSGTRSGTYQVNGGSTVPFSDASSLTVSGLGGSDTLRIENPVGSLLAPGVISLNGGSGTDVIQLTGGVADLVQFSPTGAATADYAAVAGALRQGIFISGAENVVEVNRAAVLELRGSADGERMAVTDNAIDTAPRFAVSGKLGFDFVAKDVTRVLALQGADTIAVDTDSFHPLVPVFEILTGDDPGDVIDLGALFVNSVPGVTRSIHLQNRLGPINDANGTARNLFSVDVSFDAGANVGSLLDPLEMSLTEVTGKTRSGDIVLADQSAGGDFDLVGPGGLKVTDAGSVSVTTADGPVNLAGPVTSGATAGGVALRATGGTGDIRGRSSGATVASPAGSVALTAARDIELGVAGAAANNDVSAHGGVGLDAGGSVRLGRDSDVVGNRDGATGFFPTVTAGHDVEIGTANGDGSSVRAPNRASLTARAGTLTVRAGGVDAGIDGGALTELQADRVALGPGAAVRAASGAVEVRPRTPGRGFDLGSTTDASTAAVELSDAELDRFLTPTLRLDGSTISGGGELAVTADVGLANATALTLEPGGAISRSPGAMLSVPQLAVNASSVPDLAVDVDRLAVAAGGPAHVTDANGMTVGTVDGIDGATAPELRLATTSGPLAFERPATATGDGLMVVDGHGGVGQNGAGALTAGSLRVDGASADLTAATNDLGTVAGRTTGGFAVRGERPGGWRTGDVAGASGVTSEAGDVVLRSAAETTIARPLSAPDGHAAIDAPGARVAIDAAVDGWDATVAARHLELGPDGAIGVGTGTATLRTADGRAVALGDAAAVASGAAPGPAALAVSDVELDRVTAGTVQVGHDGGGAVEVVSPVSPANAGRLAIRGAAVTRRNAADTIAADAVALFAPGAVGAAGAPIELLAGSVEASGSAVDVRDPDDLTIGGTGVVATGEADVEAGGELALAAPLTAALKVRLRAREVTSRTSGAELSAPEVALVTTGAAAADWAVTPASITRSPGAAIPYRDVADLRIAAGAGADAFTVQASPATRVHLDGADPTTVPGDVLTYDTEGREAGGDATAPDGQIVSPGRAPVAFTGFEEVEVADLSPADPPGGDPGPDPPDGDPRPDPPGGDPRPHPPGGPGPGPGGDVSGGPRDPAFRPGACANVRPLTAATTFGDRLTGTARADRISALAGDDCVSALGGNDRVSGGAGDDRLSGGRGNDRLTGGRGRDRLSGGTGSDRLIGGPGDDRLIGGSGRDRLVAGTGRNRLSGGAGDDRLDARNGRRDVVDCGRGRDVARVDRRDRVRSCERVVRR